ncbi:MAG TPA: protein-glutamate O-methyltransferase CheR [Gammaproteobacteria bacterium]|nr:protein-glutamate O-methyltransferase CheR [Gammaproteobacteria bacterium]
MNASFSRLELTDDDFDYLCTLIYDQAAIRLTSAKRELVYARLAKRVRALGLQSFRQYCDLLRGGDEGELVLCVNAITTNVTSFFREAHHFEFLEQTVLPELVEAKIRTGVRRLRLWSAGCSSGEEAYSIEIVLREQTVLQNWDVRMLATDLDTHILERAQRGIYDLKQIERVSPERRSRWFRLGIGRNEGLVSVIPGLKERISFRQINLKEPWPMHGPFDVIFCRNVVIYFDKEMQKKLFTRFADILSPDGHLFIGHSESLFGVSDRFKLAGPTVYRKVS